MKMNGRSCDSRGTPYKPSVSVPSLLEGSNAGRLRCRRATSTSHRVYLNVRLHTSLTTISANLAAGVVMGVEEARGTQRGVC